MTLEMDRAWCAWCKGKVRPSFEVRAGGAWRWACAAHAALTEEAAMELLDSREADQ